MIPTLEIAHVRFQRSDLKPALDRLYADFNYPDSAADPIQIVRRFARPDDREVVGFIAASLAFGRVTSVLQSIERVLAITGRRPAAYVRRFDPGRDGVRFKDIVHRWTRGPDLVALLWVQRQMIDASGSIEQFFVDGDDPSADDVGPGIDSFSTRALTLDLKAAYGRVPRRPGVCYFFPRASAGSGCKRLNLFLRWMVRRDALDLGVWTKVSPARLVVPLDTHVIRVGRCLGLTKYTSPGWPMARDITASLRRLDPADPVKYDFSLCHIGMMKACGFGRARDRHEVARDQQCPLRGLCTPQPSSLTSHGERRALRVK
ncbi:MAG TPA: TIGR02757 family protein [Vicinamibacterales bacterium]|nr:TIGR02757 family protein [Vicinamibacterales bacterium]